MAVQTLGGKVMYLVLGIGCILALCASLENPTFAICFSIIYGASMVTTAISTIHQTDKKAPTDESDENH